MTIKQYLFRAYFIVAALLLISGIVPEIFGPFSNYFQLMAIVAVWALFALVPLAALASSTPEERRQSFWSFRWPNYVLLFPASVAAILTVIARLL